MFQKGLGLNIGLPQSQWFKHQIYAPGLYTGYAIEPLPGIARAIDKKDSTELSQELKILEEVLKKATTIENMIKQELGGQSYGENFPS